MKFEMVAAFILYDAEIYVSIYFLFDSLPSCVIYIHILI